MRSIKGNEIRQKIYQLAKVTEAKKFRKLFPEFASYSLQLKTDLMAILYCLEAEPEAVTAVVTCSSTITGEKAENGRINRVGVPPTPAQFSKTVVSLSNYKFNKKLVACQNTEDYVELMSDLSQEIVNECREYAQYFRFKKL